MHGQPGLNTKRGAVLTALLLGVVAGAQAGDYSNVRIFGDSLTDSGAYQALVGPNARFTTNPGTVWSENLGASYGRPVSAAYAAWQTGATAGFTPVAGGNNFAVGGARVDLQPGSLNDFPLLRPFIPPVSAQVSDFLARGPVDTKALYALLGGSNDIFVQATRVSGGGSPEVAQAAVLTAANAMTAQVARLQSAGVRHLIVIGVPDIGRTPAAGSLPPAGAALLTNLTATYDAALVAGLAGRNLLFFDGNRLFNAIFADPGAYGFTNTTTPVCPGSPPDALACVAAPDGHLFADAVHWTSSLHRVVSDWVYASLEGASRVGLLSLVPIGRSGAQWRSIDDRLQQFENFGYQGQGFFVTGDQASSRQDAHDGLPSAHGSGGSFVIGYEKAFSEQLFGGVTLGYGNAPFDLGNDQGTVKYDEWALSAFAAHKFGAFYASALATWSWLDFESKRNVVLGPFSSSERGNTRGGQFGVKGQIGYNFVSGNVVHGPLAALAWERVRVDGFSEQSNSATAMTFSGQTRTSLRSRLGWQVAAETDWSGTRLRPYAQLTYDYEHDDDQHSYRAGFVGGPTAMDMPISNQNGGYGTLLAGVNAELGKSLRLGLGASTTIAQPGARSSAINVTLSAPF